tara:strand:+ start:101 stop:685 length:585 start_codon:yes stop_codon:yes gene_type:complete
MNFIKQYLKESTKILYDLDKKNILKFIKEISLVKKRKGRLFFLGMGGSAANCSHAVNDFRKLCEIEAYSPTDNVSEFSARVNDDGVSSSFKEWLRISNLNKKDLIIIFSVGGGDKKRNVSTNLVEAIDYANKKKCSTISILGKNNGYADKKSKISIIIPQVNSKYITPHSEGMQAVIWHMIISHPLLQKNKTKW